MTLVDGLRAMAALVVILPHAWVLFRDVADRPGALSDAVYLVRVHGTLGVQVFFVLSGFVIAYSLRATRMTARAFGRFVARRSVRLDPPYWVALAICCGVLWVQVHLARDGTALPTAAQVAAHVVYLQQVAGCNDVINHTYWTLCVEVQLYLAFAAAVGLLQAARLPYRAVLTVAAVAGLSYPLGWSVPGWLAVRGLFLPHAYGFLAGAVAWWAVEGTVPWRTALAAAALAAVAALRHGEVVVWVVVATASLLAVAGRRGDLARWLDHRLLQAIGRSSYGLYLLHNPVISVAVMVQHRLGWTGLPRDLLMLGGVGAGSVAAAGLLHVTVERPALRLSRRLRGGGETPLLPA